MLGVGCAVFKKHIFFKEKTLQYNVGLNRERWEGRWVGHRVGESERVETE